MDDRGHLWARLVPGAGEPTRYDVYDANGRQIAVVTSPFVFRAYTPLHFRGDHVYGVVLGADDVPYVIRARILRESRP